MASLESPYTWLMLLQYFFPVTFQAKLRCRRDPCSLMVIKNTREHNPCANEDDPQLTSWTWWLCKLSTSLASTNIQWYTIQLCIYLQKSARMHFRSQWSPSGQLERNTPNGWCFVIHDITNYSSTSIICVLFGSLKILKWDAIYRQYCSTLTACSTAAGAFISTNCKFIQVWDNRSFQSCSL